MVFNANGQLQTLEEAVEYKFFKFDKLATELPELKKIRGDMEDLNKYSTENGEQIYKKKKTFFASAIKVIRAYFALCGNLNLITVPVGWIGAAIDKLIVYAIDNNDEEEVISDVENVIKTLESLREKVSDEKTKEKLDRDIEKMRENLNRLQS